MDVQKHLVKRKVSPFCIAHDLIHSGTYFSVLVSCSTLIVFRTVYVYVFQTYGEMTHLYYWC